jgi:hypothetical protein
MPHDAPCLASLCERLSAHSSRLRFFRAGRRLSSEEARQLADIDQVRNAAVVALPDNERMLRLLESAGLRSLADEFFGVLRVYLFMARHAASTPHGRAPAAT